ncbi:CU044_5270 family protein [Actinomadura violacea]|uniref:CU044_5270 family protein n=1 Tax=Actinomadura violacea TaxID=2819934 RepID=A0ABS3RNL6_9ACTN|nr:CU044_5270 family protein [Actinomadura violacea]MBO2458347.1 CU044_5270 family protein [Actinomadura violacea]
MDDLHEVRTRHDALADPAPQTVARARARLETHMQGTRARKRSRRPVWGVGLAAAAAAAVVAATVVANGGGEGGGGGTAPLRLRTVASAQDLAGNAALVAAAGPDASPGPRQWGYLKTLALRTATDGSPWFRPGDRKVTSTTEVWSRADDWGYADFQHGKLKLHKGSEREVDYRAVLALPRDPARLLAGVYRAAGGETTAERNTNAFMYIEASMRDSAVPAKLRAAMYGALAKVPGVGYEATAHDLAGRKGVTLYRLQGDYLRDEIFIDPKTYEYLGARAIAVKDHKAEGEDMKKGDIITWYSNLATGVVDQAGQRP